MTETKTEPLTAEDLIKRLRDPYLCMSLDCEVVANTFATLTERLERTETLLKHAVEAREKAELEAPAGASVCRSESCITVALYWKDRAENAEAHVASLKAALRKIACGNEPWDREEMIDLAMQHLPEMKATPHPTQPQAAAPKAELGPQVRPFEAVPSLHEVVISHFRAPEAEGEVCGTCGGDGHLGEVELGMQPTIIRGKVEHHPAWGTEKCPTCAGTGRKPGKTEEGR